jgi:hypothetical protein
MIRPPANLDAGAEFLFTVSATQKTIGLSEVEEQVTR